MLPVPFENIGKISREAENVVAAVRISPRGGVRRTGHPSGHGPLLAWKAAGVESDQGHSLQSVRL